MVIFCIYCFLVFVTFLIHFEPFESYTNIFYIRIFCYLLLFCNLSFIVYKKYYIFVDNNDLKPQTNKNINSINGVFGYYDIEKVYSNVPSLVKYKNKKDKIETRVQRIMQAGNKDSFSNNQMEIQQILIGVHQQIQENDKSIQSQIKLIVKQLGKQNELSAVFDKSTLLYYNSSFTDITDDVIDKLNESIDEDNFKLDEIDLEELTRLVS